MERRVLGWLFVAVVGSSASMVSAQCAPGRVANEATGGRCCWPGQSWSNEQSRCEGPPTCPAGMWGEGADCVAATPPHAEIPSPPAAQPAPAAPRYAPPIEAEPRAPTETEPIVGLAVAGGVSLGVTYLATVVGTAINMASCYSGCEEFALNFIPVVGPIAWVAYDSGRYSGYSTMTAVFYFPASIIQAVSFTLLLAGVIIQRPARAAPRSWQPELTGGPGNVGMGLRWTF